MATLISEKNRYNTKFSKSGGVLVEEKKRSQENNRRNKYGHDKEEVDVTADKRVDRAN